MKRIPRTARRGATVGLAIASVALLSACGTTQAGGSGGGEAATELGDMEGSVSILTWPGYVEDGSNDPAVDWVSAFEEKTGCEVTSKTYGTSDEAFNLFKSGDYDGRGLGRQVAQFDWGKAQNYLKGYLGKPGS